MTQTQNRPLKQVFNDEFYAWQLLESQIKLETSNNISSQDVAYLLQLYMKGVEKMNSFLDYREAYFKEKVMTLMSRPAVMKTLNNKNNLMSKKNVPAEAKANKEQKTSFSSPTNNNSRKDQQSNSGRKLQSNAQILLLKQKKKQIQVRLAYGAQQNSPQIVKNLIKQQSQKQTKISQKITKIVESHQQSLAKRIKQRKLKTSAAKSLCNILTNNDELVTNNKQICKGKGNKKITQQFFSCPLIEQNQRTREQRRKNDRRYNSLPVRRLENSSNEKNLIKKSVSQNMWINQQIQNRNLSCSIQLQN